MPWTKICKGGNVLIPLWIFWNLFPKRFVKLLQYCSLHATTSDAGLLVTPDTDLFSLYSARNILLHEFQTTAGCSVLCANIWQKLSRIHYFICPRPTLVTATAALFQVCQPPDPFAETGWLSNNISFSSYERYFSLLNVEIKHHSSTFGLQCLFWHSYVMECMPFNSAFF